MTAVASLMVIHKAVRVPVETVQIFRVPVDDVRAALARPPDFHDAHVTAWGCVSRAEADRVVARVRDEGLRRDLVTEIEGLYAKADGHFVSLHYCDPYSAMPPGREADRGK